MRVYTLPRGKYQVLTIAQDTHTSLISSVMLVLAASTESIYQGPSVNLQRALSTRSRLLRSMINSGEKSDSTATVGSGNVIFSGITSWFVWFHSQRYRANFMQQYRSLESLLLSPKYPSSSRVIWTSSLKALPNYTLDDFQLKETRDSYGAVKHQTELVATHLDRIELRKAPGEKRVRHLITHPGVCSTKIASAMVWPLLEYVKVWVFYLVCTLVTSKAMAVNMGLGKMARFT